MRVLLDQNIAVSIVEPLRSRGIDAIHTGAVDLATAPDEQILEWCRGEGRVAFTRAGARGSELRWHALLHPVDRCDDAGGKKV